MAGAKSFLTASFEAGKDMSLYKYAIMTDVQAQPNVVQFAVTSTEWPIGVLQNDPKSSGLAADLAIAGMPLVKLGGKVTSRSLLVANASGFGVSCATTTGIPVGRAVVGGSTGDLVPVLIGANSAIGADKVLGTG